MILRWCSNVCVCVHVCVCVCVHAFVCVCARVFEKKSYKLLGGSQHTSLPNVHEFAHNMLLNDPLTVRELCKRHGTMSGLPN